MSSPVKSNAPFAAEPYSTVMSEIIDAYMAAWNEPDGARRDALLRKCWADDGVYTDPGVYLVGAKALSARIALKQSERPGTRLVLLSAVDSHHGRFRFHWRLVSADGSHGPKSVDFGALAPDGRIAQMVGFFGPPPADGD